MNIQLEKQQRDQEILRLWNEEALTYEEIGARFGVTRERARQIIRQKGGKAASSVRKNRHEKKIEAAEADVQELYQRAASVIEKLYLDGRTKAETASVIRGVFPGYADEVVDEALRVSGFVFAQAKQAPQFSDDLVRAAVYFVLGEINDFDANAETIASVVPLDMVKDLVEHAEFEPFPSRGTDLVLRRIAGAIEAIESGAELSLSHQAYEKTRIMVWSAEGWAGGAGTYWPPTKQTVMKRLGDSYWEDAMLALGLKPSARRGRPRGLVKYTVADYEAAVRDYLGYCSAYKLNPTFERFEAWVAQEKVAGRGRPSSVSVRNAFGSWISALQSKGLPGALSIK